MYNYLLNVSAANKKAILNEEITTAIKNACQDANGTTNSIRHGRNFSYITQIDEYTVQLRLKSNTSIIATRAISSITRALIRICPTELLKPLQYNGSLLTATVIEEFEEGCKTFENRPPHEIVKTVIEIFFGQASLGKNDKKIAKEAADKIKDVVVGYKTDTQK